MTSKGPEIDPTSTEVEEIHDTEDAPAISPSKLETSSKEEARPHEETVHPIAQLPLTWLAAFTASALFVLTAIYAWRTTFGMNRTFGNSSPSNIIRNLRILSEITSLLFACTIAATMERLQWMLVNRRRGVALFTYLSLDAGTGVMGLLSLILIKGRKKLGCRAWGLFRLALIALVPVLSTVLLSDVRAQTSYISRSSFPVAAGIGDFNASLVKDWSNIAGIFFATDISNFLNNPAVVAPVKPIQKPTGTCASSAANRNSAACSASYFLAGGMDLISPWPSRNHDFPDSSTYMVKNVAGYQLDYGELDEVSAFDGTTDCQVYGQPAAAIQMCVASAENNTLLAKLVNCPLSLSADSKCLDDNSWESSTGLSTTVSVYRRKATVVFSRYNSSIVSLSDLSPARSVAIKPSDLSAVYNASFSDSASSFTSSAGNQFILYLSNYLTISDSASTSYGAKVKLRNLLALPLQYFHANYLDSSLSPSPDKPATGLPKELYTRAEIADPVYQLVLSRPTLWAYMIGGALILLLCIAALLLGSLPMTAGGISETTVWPVVDFARNCKVGRTRDSTSEDVPGTMEPGGLRFLNGMRRRELRLSMEGLRLWMVRSTDSST